MNMSIYNANPRPAPTAAYHFRLLDPSPTLYYIHSLKQASFLLNSFDTGGALGFDIEWRPTYQKGLPENPVALLQLANYSSILLFHLSSMGACPLELVHILQSPNVVKAGVGIQGDAQKLFRDWGIAMRNCVDLSLLTRTVDNSTWSGVYNSSIGLARLIECYEYKLLVKSKICRSDWSNHPLSTKQKDYAANDAHAGYTLYKYLHAMIPRLPSLPDPSCYTFNVLHGILCNDDGHVWLATNPDYDPGVFGEPKVPTEAQIKRNQKRADILAAKKAAIAILSATQPDATIYPDLASTSGHSNTTDITPRSRYRRHASSISDSVSPRKQIRQRQYSAQVPPSSSSILSSSASSASSSSALVPITPPVPLSTGNL